MAHCERWSVPVGNEGGAEQVPNLAKFCEAGTLNDHASTGNRHSHHELQGLNDTTSEVAPVRATQSPIRPSNTKNDEESEVIDESEEIEEIESKTIPNETETVADQVVINEALRVAKKTRRGP